VLSNHSLRVAQTPSGEADDERAFAKVATVLRHQFKKLILNSGVLDEKVVTVDLHDAVERLFFRSSYFRDFSATEIGQVHPSFFFQVVAYLLTFNTHDRFAQQHVSQAGCTTKLDLSYFHRFIKFLHTHKVVFKRDEDPVEEGEEEGEEGEAAEEV